VWEVRSAAYNRGAKCVVVAVGDGLPERDPSDRELLRVRQLSRERVVPLSKAQDCPGGDPVWAAEPWCGRYQNAYVRTTGNDHCPLEDVLQGSRWVPWPRGGCE
jgi:hypothetical protein